MNYVMSDMATLNINNPTEVRTIGLKALKEALGTVGSVKFMQQFENSYGDYTKEKYNRPDESLDDLDKELTDLL